jgi:hypothetical protein
MTTAPQHGARARSKNAIRRQKRAFGRRAHDRRVERVLRSVAKTTRRDRKKPNRL